MASTSISKTYSSAGNRQKWTWSAWIKRSSLTSASNGPVKEVVQVIILFFK